LLSGFAIKNVFANIFESDLVIRNTLVFLSVHFAIPPKGVIFLMAAYSNYVLTSRWSKLDFPKIKASELAQRIVYISQQTRKIQMLLDPK